MATARGTSFKFLRNHAWTVLHEGHLEEEVISAKTTVVGMDMCVLYWLVLICTNQQYDHQANIDLSCRQNLAYWCLLVLGILLPQRQVGFTDGHTSHFDLEHLSKETAPWRLYKHCCVAKIVCCFLLFCCLMFVSWRLIKTGKVQAQHYETSSSPIPFPSRLRPYL